MTAAARCLCPDVPALTHPIPGAIVCACCGEPLTITCAGCGTGHVTVSIAAAVASTLSTSSDGAKRVAGPRVYAAKACHTCGNPFQPTGPRAIYCPTCKGGSA